MVILVSTLGFDEKFIIRFLMRYAGNFKELYVITAEPMDDRVLKAYSSVKEFVDRYLGGISLNLIKVNPQDYLNSVNRIKEIFRGKGSESFVINASGGMRALIIELILAAVLSRVNGYLEIELENFLGVVRIPLNTFYLAPLSSEEYLIIREIARRGEASVKELIRELGIPRSSLYKYLKDLVRRGLLEVTRVGKISKYKVSEIAKLLT